VAEQTTSTAKAARGCGLQIKHASAASGHDQNYTGIQMDSDGKICIHATDSDGKICERNEEKMRGIRKKKY
jgi:hypothetical protein